ncbi:MotE family protein [Desulfovibrio cuneatus]|uniref:MotE family protein n=1 Tax=Desulfovibrio cuneatus TaxID=159728 RepID=UPI0003F91C88|nr:hypothetical protein [Desulfovibrio cuneatus]
MMKQQRSGTTFSPSRVGRLLFLALAIKAGIAGFLLFEPGNLSLFDTSVPASKVMQGTVANAAEAAPAAPPAIPPTPATGAAAPQTESTTLPPASANRSLPAIVQKPEDKNATSSDPLTRDMLTRKQEELARKEQELRTLEQQLAEKLQRMEMLENRLGTMMKEAEKTNDAQFRHLVEVLSNMRARSAAQVLETMDQRIAVRVLAGMRGRQAGEILSFVKPEIAASLTAALTRMQMPLE